MRHHQTGVRSKPSGQIECGSKYGADRRSCPLPFSLSRALSSDAADRSASERLKHGLLDDTIFANLQLQLHHIAARRGAHEACEQAEERKRAHHTEQNNERMRQQGPNERGARQNEGEERAAT